MQTDREQRCLDYINSNLEEPLPGLEFRAWKSCADIRDIDIYHKVAQVFDQQELKLGFAGLFYMIRVPEYEGDRFGDQWSVNLIGKQDNEFLDKYGDHYTVIYRS